MNATVSSTDSAAPLHARNLIHCYENSNALNGVSLTVPEGSVLGLIGRNGAGKSTLLRALLGLLKPLSGDAQVFGVPALGLTDPIKERISFVPQQPEALAWLSATQMFEYLGHFYPRWDHAFALAKLDHWNVPAQRTMAKLSPGERQRVDLIRALASQPDLMVLDEPAAALDPVARRELLREIALRAGESGTTVLFSTHIVSDLERVASDVAFLHQGKLLLHCSVDQTKEQYARLWLPPGQTAAAPEHALSRRRHADGSMTLVVVRDESHRGLDGSTLQGARMDTLGLEDLFVEVAE